jgi:O-antigen ligase
VRFWQLLLAKGTDSVSHFLFGRGAGATFQIGAEDLGASLWAHNDFVELFITGGVILAGAYVILLGWIFATIVQLRRDPGQSRKVRSFCSLAFGALAGYVLISSTDGVIMAAGGVVMAAFVGLIGGMRQTPGSTFLDHSDTATAASYDDVATGRDRRRSPSPWRRTA